MRCESGLKTVPVLQSFVPGRLELSLTVMANGNMLHSFTGRQACILFHVVFDKREYLSPGAKPGPTEYRRSIHT